MIDKVPACRTGAVHFFFFISPYKSRSLSGSFGNSPHLNVGVVTAGKNCLVGLESPSLGSFQPNCPDLGSSAAIFSHS